MKPQQVFDGAIEVNAVVEAGAEHDLPMHLNSGIRQPLDLRHKTVVFLDAEQSSPEFRLRRMHGNVKRRQALLNNAVEFSLIDVRQRQVIPEEERQSIILIFDVKRPPDILRILMDEAEHALVLAGHRFDRLELESERFPFAPHESDRAILRPNRGPPPDVCGVELKIDDVEQRLAVQFVDFVARFQADSLGKGIRTPRTARAGFALRRLRCGGSIAIFVHRLPHVGRAENCFLSLIEDANNAGP